MRAEEKAKDEADRIKWAKVSLEVLAEVGWVQPPHELGEAGVERMLTRLRKGMRVRTLKTRAQSLCRILRWAKIANSGRWPDCAESIEDYMNDLSTEKVQGCQPSKGQDTHSSMQKRR